MAPLKPVLLLAAVILVLSCSGNYESKDFGDPPTPESCFCDPDGVAAYLKWVWKSYPEISELRVIGESERGRSIYALEISDNPSVSEDEPAILVNGAIHGHEQISAGIPMKLIEHLITGWDSGDSDSVYLIENFKLHFIPAVNPDGLAESERYNDNFVDLNRNFGWNWETTQLNSGDYAFDQSESRAIRDDFNDIGYCLSLNLHTASGWGSSSDTDGGVGIYAPWDAIETDEPGFADLYLPNYYSFIEPEGLSYAEAVVDAGVYPFDYYFHFQEGADWYPFQGSLSDWALGIHGTLSYTIELHGEQNFSVYDSYQLVTTWDAHKTALLDIIRCAELGTGGRVVDGSGSPLEGVEITLNYTGSRSTDPIPYPDLKALTDKNGRFRLLTGPGQYEIAISKTGYSEPPPDSINVETSGGRGLTDGEFFPEYVLTEE